MPDSIALELCELKDIRNLIIQIETIIFNWLFLLSSAITPILCNWTVGWNDIWEKGCFWFVTTV